jgi:hypothetical protein
MLQIGLQQLSLFRANSWVPSIYNLKKAAGKNVQKLKRIQDEFVSNLEVMKKFKKRVHQYDMRTLLQVPDVYCDIVGEDAWDARWDASNPYCKIVDLTIH